MKLELQKRAEIEVGWVERPKAKRLIYSVFLFYSALLSSLILGAASTTAGTPSYETFGKFDEQTLNPVTGAIVERRSGVFTCHVDGELWRIDLKPSELPPEEKKVGKQTFVRMPISEQSAASDGTNFFETKVVDTYAASNAVMQWMGTVTNRGAQSAMVRNFAWMGPGNEPFGIDETELVIWYSFASSDYLRRNANRDILPLYRIRNRDVQSSNFLAQAKWKILPGYPGLPEWMQSSNFFIQLRAPSPQFDLKRSAFAHTNVNMRIVATTNYNGLMLPTHIKVDYFVPQRILATQSIGVFHTRSVEITVDHVASPAENCDYHLALSGPSEVEDISYWFANPPNQVTVFVTNGWPGKSITYPVYLHRVKVNSTKLPPSTRASIVKQTLIFVTVGSIIVGWWICKKYKPTTNTTERMECKTNYETKT